MDRSGHQRQAIAFYTKTWLSSGAGLFAQQLARGTADAGGDVVFVAPPAQDPAFEAPRRGLSRLASRREAQTGSRLARALASVGRVLSSAGNLARARMKARTFVVTIPDPLVFALPMLAMLRLSGARIIYVVHDPLPHAWKLPAALRKLENGSFAAAYKLSSALVVLSGSAASALASAYALGTRPIVVIEHGSFDLGLHSALPGAGRLLLFGTLRRNKGILEAIEGVIAARARGAAVTLLIAGAPDPIEPDYWAQCATLARQHPEAVTLEEGYVSDERLETLVTECDAFILPYRNFHSQSGVAMVAASNGRPVIASRAGGVGDLIDDGLAGVAIEEPVDGSAVADAIVAFASVTPAAWSEKAAAYQEKTNEKRAWPVIGGEYLDLAKRLGESEN